MYNKVVTRWLVEWFISIRRPGQLGREPQFSDCGVICIWAHPGVNNYVEYMYKTSSSTENLLVVKGLPEYENVEI